MTHEETWRLLPRYASGALATTDAAGVCAHLATGCSTCVEALFRGAFADSDGAAPPPVAAGVTEGRLGASGRRRAWLRRVSVGGLVVMAGMLGWQLGRESAAPVVAEERVRLARFQEAEATWHERLQRLTRELETARASGEEAAEAARVAGEANDGLRRELAEALARAERAERPPATVPPSPRDLARLEVRRLLIDLAGRAGVALDPLLPIVQTSSARGHVFWHAQRSDVVLFAFGLPGLPAGAFYRARMLLDGGWVDDGTAFRPTSRGEVLARLRVPGGIGGLRGLEIVAEPDGTAVLRGPVGPGAD